MLFPEGPFVEERSPMMPPPAERQALSADLVEAGDSIVAAPLRAELGL